MLEGDVTFGGARDLRSEVEAPALEINWNH